MPMSSMYLDYDDSTDTCCQCYCCCTFRTVISGQNRPRRTGAPTTLSDFNWFKSPKRTIILILATLFILLIESPSKHARGSSLFTRPKVALAVIVKLSSQRKARGRRPRVLFLYNVTHVIFNLIIKYYTVKLYL